MKDRFWAGKSRAAFADSSCDVEHDLERRVQRLPGIESSRLGLESLTGKLDEFDFGTYLNSPTESEATPIDMHSLMEAQLKLQTKPASRGI